MLLIISYFIDLSLFLETHKDLRAAWPDELSVKAFVFYTDHTSSVNIHEERAKKRRGKNIKIQIQITRWQVYHVMLYRHIACK